MRRRVVVTGVGAVTPLGLGAGVLHERWCAGDSGVVDGVARCDEFVPDEVLPRKLARRSDRVTQLALAAGAEALNQAGWVPDRPFAPERVACIVGTGIGGVGTLIRGHDTLRARGVDRVSSLTVPSMMPNAPAAVMAMHLDIRGPVFGTVSACAAGADAIGVAARAIAAGDCDAALAGGAEAAHADIIAAAFSAMDAISKSGISRPFDARRDGFVMGEGAGMIVLEGADVAARRNAQVLGELRGYGATADAYHLTAPPPDGAGAARAIRRALEDAGVAPEEVDYVNAHGTSTLLNDRSETAALKAALGEWAYAVPVSSTKSAIGHLLGASGAVEAVATVLALADGVAPPTVGWELRDDGLDLDYAPDGPRALRANGRPPVAISNSFGFGGHNAVLCFQGVG